MNLLPASMDLADLQNALTRLATALNPPELDVAGLANARKLFAEIAPLFQALADGPLGQTNPEVTDDDEPEGDDQTQLGATMQLSAETKKRLRRIGLNPKYAGITTEGQLFDMKFAEAEEKRALEARAKAGSKVTRARGVN